MQDDVVIPLVVGRDRQLAELRGALSDASANRGSLILVAGEPGIGKTTLVESLAREAATRGADTRWATCWEGEGAPAFWPWIQILRSHNDWDPADPDAASVGDPEQARFRLFDSVTSRLREATLDRTVVVVLDDLQWADISSLRLLRFLAPQLRTMGALVVGTYRDRELDPLADAARFLAEAATQARVITLRGFGDEDVAALLANETGTPPPAELVRDVRRRTGGNAFFIREIARLLQDGTGLDVVPEGIRAVVGHRLDHLSSDARELLEVASVIGREVRIDILAEAAGLDRVSTLELFAEAEARNLVTDAPAMVGRYVFAHDLVREVLYHAVPRDRRTEIHRRIAEALERSETSPAVEIADHLLLASESGAAVDRALEWAEHAAGELLEALGYEEAARLIERALDVAELGDVDDARRIDLLLLLGDARLRAGDMPSARSAFDRVARMARLHGRPEDLARAALGFGAGLSGFEVRLFDRAQLDLLAEALEALGRADSALRALVAARLSVALSLMEPEERRLELATEAVAMARRTGDDRALAYALSAHCDAIAGPDHANQRLAEADEIVRCATRACDPALELLGRRFRIMALLEHGDLTSFAAEIDQFERTAERLGQPLYSWYVPLWRATLASARGRMDEAAALTDEADRIGRAAHSDNAHMLVRVQRYMAAFESGDIPAASRVLDDMIAHHGWTGPTVDITKAWMAAMTGATAEASKLLRRHTADGFGTLPRDAEWLPAMCQAADVMAVTSDAVVAAAVYDALHPYADLFGIEGIGAWVHGSIERHLGQAAHALGRWDDAAAHFDRAIDADRRAGATLPLATTLRRYARMLVDAGMRTDDAYEMAAEADRLVETPASIEPVPPAANSFRRNGEIWTLTYDGRTIGMRDAKGLHDIASLLGRPGTHVPALELVAASEGIVATSSPGREDLASPGAGDPVLDDRARREYRTRLEELREEIDDARTMNDPVRAERAQQEMDGIAQMLASSLGLGGRPRRAPDAAERARKAVTQRIANAIKRIDREHPSLASHLAAFVNTGSTCSYSPTDPVDWIL